MNNIAISPHIFMYALQNQNVERKTAKQIDIKSLQQEQEQGKEETTNISELKSSSTEIANANEIGVVNEITNEIGITNEIIASANELATDNHVSAI